MTLEQRIEELEKKVASLTLPSATAEELAKMMRDVVAETIKNARRPGGALYKLDQEAAKAMTATYEVRVGVNYDKERDRLLDIATTSLHDSLHLSRL